MWIYMTSSYIAWKGLREWTDKQKDGQMGLILLPNNKRTQTALMLCRCDFISLVPWPVSKYLSSEGLSNAFKCLLTVENEDQKVIF